MLWTLNWISNTTPPILECHVLFELPLTQFNIKGIFISLVFYGNPPNDLTKKHSEG